MIKLIKIHLRCVRSLKDDFFMDEALKEAKRAFILGEVPVGAVITFQEKIIARGLNLREEKQDPTAHAEMIAIREASKVLGGWRLVGCKIYVTLEPCPMCAGAMVLSRLEELIYGASDPKAGAAGTIVDLVNHPSFNHRLQVRSGIREMESRNLLQDFFAQLRIE